MWIYMLAGFLVVGLAIAMGSITQDETSDVKAVCLSGQEERARLRTAPHLSPAERAERTSRLAVEHETLCECLKNTVSSYDLTNDEKAYVHDILKEPIQQGPIEIAFKGFDYRRYNVTRTQLLTWASACNAKKARRKPPN